MVVVVGVQQLYQFEASWTNYRSTAEAPKHEQFCIRPTLGPTTESAIQSERSPLAETWDYAAFPSATSARADAT